MTTTSTIAYTVHALPSAVLDQVRADDVDASGNRVEHLVAEGGEPLRCCLRGADRDDELILFGYEPPLPASPYREMGAVFAHGQPCAGPTDSGGYPEAWRGRSQILRAYDARGWIHETTRVHDGSDPDRVIAEIFAAPEVSLIHSRNVSYGCYMFSITRAGG